MLPGEAPVGVVLVVEDDEDLLSAIISVLEDASYVVVHTTAGESALTLLQAIAVSIIITDLTMPGMDGLAFIKAVAASERGAQIPIVLMSGSRDLTETPAGCVAMLAKPFSLDALLAVVKEHARPLPPSPSSPGARGE